MNHPLHKIIGEVVNPDAFPGCVVLKDHACGGEQNIPLFSAIDKSRKAEFCNVNLLILRSERIKVIIEIEETDIKPTQICGKFLTSAIANYYIHESHNNEPIPMDESVLFIQILDTAKIKKGETPKIDQWRDMEKSIQDIIPVEGSMIDYCKLFYGDNLDFSGESGVELTTHIKDYLSKNNILG